MTSPLLATHKDYLPETPQIDLNSVTEQMLLTALSLQKSHFLGPYFESLWRFLIEQAPSHELLHHGLQINRNGQTLGEFDFILRNSKTNRLIHQEIAVKFYLGVRAPSPLRPSQTAWFGPNSIDRLDLKLAKMLDHQIQLADYPESRTQLATLGFWPPTKQMAMKGYLFRPLGDVLNLPAYSHSDVATGEWLTIDRIEELRDLTERWVILPKLHWLSQASCSSDDILSFRAMTSKVRQNAERPHLIAALNSAGDSFINQRHYRAKNYVEMHRYFVVSSHWQARALASLTDNPLTQYA